MTKATDPDGKKYEYFCFHTDTVPMWLATIKAGRLEELKREAGRIRCGTQLVLRLADAPASTDAPATSPVDIPRGLLS
jgi:hypothetical protein